MKIISAEFITSAVTPKQYPHLDYPELAFVGRSNVGKSSLINSLLNRKKLVKTSATPGKTQLINFFNINDQFIFTDLPGYGYAKVAKQTQAKWQNMVEQYLLKRKNLILVILILDYRRKPTELDLQMQEWLENHEIPYSLVITKADKLNQAERSKQIKIIKKVFLNQKALEMISYSSKENLGRKELWGHLGKLIKESLS